MAHMIDVTTGKAAIAYVGQTPWHGLGQQLTAGAGIEQWKVQAGLNYEVLRSVVEYETMSSDPESFGQPLRYSMPDRHVLFRSDTGAPLSVVSKDYKLVQPGEVLDFFGKLADVGGFDLETAGALSDGRRIWALAKVSDGAPIVGQDVVRPYLLLATSYDGTMATTAKFTAVRVVCNNTITMAVGRFDGQSYSGKTESDTENQAVSSMVRIPHSKVFDAEAVRRSLGIVSSVFDRWLINTRVLAERDMAEAEADEFLCKLFGGATRDGKLIDPRITRGYQRVMQLFSGDDLIGSDLTGGHNRWGMLNAVTQFVDWERGRSDDTRMSSAWFGAGEGIKNKAYEILID